jgi:hypothetical protein
MNLAGTNWARRTNAGVRPTNRYPYTFYADGRFDQPKYPSTGTWRPDGDAVIVEGMTTIGEPPRERRFKGSGKINGQTLEIRGQIDAFAPDVDPTPSDFIWTFDLMEN